LASCSAGRRPGATPVIKSEAPDEPVIQLVQRDKDFAIEVLHLPAADLAHLNQVALSPAQWTALFTVHVEKGAAADRSPQPAVLGSYRVRGDALCFEPRFPLRPGLSYRARFDPAQLPGHAADEKPVVAVLSLPPPPPAPATVLQHVYPSTNHLPENQLKFYLHFSAPMSRGEAYRHIHLLQASGKEVDLPFLELDEELWDPQGKRFTLFFDPGRIKRGLKPREEVGPALEEGKSYTLVIDRDWADARGNPLREAYRKSFRVGPPDDQPPDPKTWKLQPPPAGTSQPVVVTFPKPMEHGLLERVLWVTDSMDQTVPGSVTVTAEETCWQFTPQRAWEAGAYQLVVETTLEDLAGNSIAHPFEIDQFHRIQRQEKAARIRLPFEVRR
jgi:hypothetical protein